MVVIVIISSYSQFQILSHQTYTILIQLYEYMSEILTLV